MKTSSLNDIKKELQSIGISEIRTICLRLGRFKKENKEMLHYLLFEAQDEQGYTEGTKEEIAEQFALLDQPNVYLLKKSLRKILRMVNRQVRYSGISRTELELRIYFCQKMKENKVPMREGTVLYNLFQQQVKKSNAVFSKLPEDLQADYQREMANLK